jgi:hypothetical protein
MLPSHSAEWNQRRPIGLPRVTPAIFGQMYPTKTRRAVGWCRCGGPEALGYEHSEWPSMQAATTVDSTDEAFSETEEDGELSAPLRWSLPSIGFELPQLTVSRVLVRNTCRR